MQSHLGCFKKIYTHFYIYDNKHYSNRNNLIYKHVRQLNLCMSCWCAFCVLIFFLNFDHTLNEQLSMLKIIWIIVSLNHQHAISKFIVSHSRFIAIDEYVTAKKKSKVSIMVSITQKIIVEVPRKVRKSNKSTQRYCVDHLSIKWQ
jgi:hypothetical protein